MKFDQISFIQKKDENILKTLIHDLNFIQY